MDCFQPFTDSIIVPALQRLVYSTCSVHEKENENVVIKALESQPDPPQFVVADKASVIPSWHRRGVRSDKYGELERILSKNLV